MASLSIFQPYVDKENADSVGARPKARGSSVTGLGGKVFQGTTPSLTTPRKALRDVNQDLSLSVTGQGARLQQKPKGLGPQQDLFKKPVLQLGESLQSANKPNKIQIDSHKKQKSSIKPHVDRKEKSTVKKPDPLPDIERMYIYDDKEDIQPLKDIDFSGVISKLINWRPPCLFGSRPAESEGESDTEEIDYAIDIIPPPDIDQFEEEERVLEDIPYIDVDLPSLSESFDLELGSLELHNSSTPISLSPTKS